jgi:hypothetical protein
MNMNFLKRICACDEGLETDERMPNNGKEEMKMETLCP